MAAGPSGGGQDAAPAGGADDGVEVDMELLYRRMKEVQAEGEGGDENDDEEDTSFVTEVSVGEAPSPVIGDENDVVVVEQAASGDSDSDVHSDDTDDTDDTDDDDDAGENKGDGLPVVGQLKTRASLESNEMTYYDCSSLYIILCSAQTTVGSVYTIEVEDRTVVPAFACLEDAGRYAGALTDTPVFKDKSITIQLGELLSSELEVFCLDAGWRLGFVPASTLFSPDELLAFGDVPLSPSSSSPLDALRDGGMAEGEADAQRERLEELLGKDVGDA
ncbi:hypothetical protein MMPV_005328 [Pyropia vietnamensis]